jgi:O-antigen ligase
MASAATWALPVRTAAAERADPQSLRLGLLLSVAFAAALAGAYVIDVEPEGKAVALLGGVLAAVALLAAFLRPVWVPLLFAAYLPFSVKYPIALVTAVNMTNLLLGLGVVAAVVTGQRDDRRVGLGAFEGLLVLYLLLGAIGIARAISADPGTSFVDQLLVYKRWASPMVLFFLVRQIVRGRRQALTTASAVALAALLVAGATCLDGYDLSATDARGEGRVTGIIGQPNSLGAFLDYYGILFLAAAVRGRGRRLRAGAAAAFLVSVRAMMFTLSRGAYLALGGASIAVLLLGNPLYLAGAGLLGGVVATTAPEAIPPSVTARLGHTFSDREVGYDAPAEETLDKSSAERLVLWRAGLAMAREEPWLGMGLGRFQQVVPLYTEEALTEDSPRDAHNAYILTLAELGAPAAVVMVVLLLWLGGESLLLYLGGRTWVDRTIALGFVGTVVAVAVSCSFGSRFSDENLIGLFWIMAALVRTLRAGAPARRLA